MDAMRADMVAHLGENDSTVVAYDVWQRFKAAQSHGLEVEWFETFLAEVAKPNADPRAAADYACREWDL